MCKRAEAVAAFLRKGVRVSERRGYERLWLVAANVAALDATHGLGPRYPEGEDADNGIVPKAQQFA
jgi:hypothetical protein